MNDLLRKNGFDEKTAVKHIPNGEDKPKTGTLKSLITDTIIDEVEPNRLNNVINNFFSKRDPIPKTFRTRVSDIIVTHNDLVKFFGEKKEITPSLDEIKTSIDELRKSAEDAKIRFPNITSNSTSIQLIRVDVDKINRLLKKSTAARYY